MFDKEYYARVPKTVLSAMKVAGADSASCTVELLNQVETNCLGHDEYLLREFEDLSVTVSIIKNSRGVIVKLNQLDDESLAASARRAVAMADAAPEADEKPSIAFRGGLMPDLYIERPAPEKLYARFEEMMAAFRADYPDLNMDGMAWHSRQVMFFENTDGETHTYDFCNMECGWQVAATDHIDSTTDCVSYFTPIEDIDTPFLDTGLMREKLELARRMLHPQKLSGEKFSGTLLLQPDGCMMYLGQVIMRADEMKEGDGLPNPECSPGFSVFFTNSDVKYAKDSPVMNSPNTEKEYTIREGKPIPEDTHGLEGEELSRYYIEKSKKLPYTLTGIEYDKEQPYAQLLKGIKRGILVGHIQGSMPAPNGDFSGAAKNSFYIEDGEIKFPLVECMVSGNAYELFKNVRGVSSERFFLRDALLPYIAVDGAIII